MSETAKRAGEHGMKTVEMKTIESIPRLIRDEPKPLVALVVPAFNEAAIVEKNLAVICSYMDSIADTYRWELILVNDGSADETGKLAEAFARTRPNVRVLHHATNLGMGRAFRTAFEDCDADYVVTLDLDLTYSTDHISAMLTQLRATHANVVVASPYMDGGRLSNVPPLRRTLSIWANRFLSIAARGHLSTLTGMVRAYDGRFLRTLDLKSQGAEVNPEIIYKSKLLNARITEIPGHLNWGIQRAERVARQSKITMRMVRHMLAVMLSGFLFRPVMFFVMPGLALFLFSMFSTGWALIHSYDQFRLLASQYPEFGRRASASVAAAFVLAPHTFILGGITGMLSVQLISLGILALQSKSYFEEIFHLGTTVYRTVRNGQEIGR
jgi:glycosyltransferase involved in cell wall biosynthesis